MQTVSPIKFAIYLHFDTTVEFQNTHSVRPLTLARDEVLPCSHQMKAVILSSMTSPAENAATPVCSCSIRCCAVSSLRAASEFAARLPLEGA